MELGGFAGRVLYVDLTSNSVYEEPLNREWVRDLLGGWGINNKIAFDLIPPDADPLSPQNAIIIGAGPFSGTTIPGSAELTITTKFPINGAIATCSGGGSFSLMLKTSGYDHVVITGRAPKPVYLKISDDGIELVDAGDLWGKDSFDTVDELRLRHEPCSIIPIGPAGENLVRISVTQIDKGGSVGAGGLPAVMGSKNLKAAVAVQGAKGIKVADRSALARIVNQLVERMMKWPGREPILQVGWGGIVAYAMKGGTEGGSRPFDKDQAAQVMGLLVSSRKRISCASCPMADKQRVDVRDGRLAGTTAYGSHMLLRRFGDEDVVEAFNRSVQLEDMANRYGIDLLNFHGVMTLMAYLYDQGKIGKEDTGGIELKEDFSNNLELMKRIAYREGFGDIMADGIMPAAKRIGKGAEEDAAKMQVKGSFHPQDPRRAGFGTMEMTLAVDPRGMAIGAGGSVSYTPGRPPSDFLRHGQRQGIPEEALGRIVTETSWNVGRYLRYTHDWYSLFTCLGQCSRASVARFLHIETLAELYAAVTGISVTPTELLKAAERAFNLYKILNIRAGFGRKDDKAPDFWFTPLRATSGKEYSLTDYYKTTTLTKEDIDRLIDDYHDERGWDKETGVPTPQKLRELGLETYYAGQ